MTTCRGVHDDQIESAFQYQLLDLGQYQQVTNAGCGGGNHVEQARRGHAFGQQPQTVIT